MAYQIPKACRAHHRSRPFRCKAKQWCAATILLFTWSGPLLAQDGDCGEIYNTGHFGPFDWRDRSNIGHVELAHFGPKIQSLRGGEWDLAGNISYLLLASPNHPRALVAAVGLAERYKTNKTEHMEYSIECWFDRAIRFKPEDYVVRVLFADYLGKHGRKDDGVRQLDAASIIEASNGYSQYNIGLGYLALGAYRQAADAAKRAQALGVGRTDLMAELKRLNHWSDDSVPAPGIGASSSSP